MKKRKKEAALLKIIKELQSRKKALLILACLGIFFDLFFINIISDSNIFFLVCLWILVIWLYRLPNKIFISGGLIFLTFCTFFSIFGKRLIADKFAIWAYIYLAIGITQIVFKYIKEEKKVSKNEK